MPVSLTEFVRKWKISSLTELQSAQSHFNEICDLIGQPNPTDADPAGEFFCFNKGLTKNYGGKGYADVWKRGYFAWEYKGKHKDLRAAYKQINDYREDLLNPPLLVVCDTNIFQIHTNFQNTAKRVYEFNLDDLGKNRITAKCPLPPLDVLRALFNDFNVLRPDRTDAFVTQEAARLFATLAERLEIEQKLSATPQQIANFLIRILFCIFADAIGLLPDHLFRQLLAFDRFNPRRFLLKLPQLFAAMSAPDGMFGIYNIRYFNGGLFDPSRTDDLAVVQLDKQDMAVLHKVAHDHNWAHVAPAIFGTLFERSLNKERRSLIGAHYTGEEDILLLIEPVVMRPLRQRWEDTKSAVLQTPGIGSPDALLHSNPQAEQLLAAFFDHLSTVRILDPACGSGNFLYVALRRLLDLWLEARDFVKDHKIQLMQQYAETHLPSPRQLLGIEFDDYAHRLASIVVWIGFLQWKHEHAVNEEQDPVLDPLSTIEHNDAILRYDAEGKPYEPAWPPADFIVGNPPFLGGQDMQGQLTKQYVGDLRKLYTNRIAGSGDLVLYWFEKARALIAAKSTKRAGLIGTQAIRGGENRKVLKAIKESGDIFWARSDKKWLRPAKKLGKIAMVQVSLVAFDDGSETLKELDGVVVGEIFANLKSGLDTTHALRLPENRGLSFQGPVKVGKFEISPTMANAFKASSNPHGKPNTNVLRPWMNGNDIKFRPKNRWIIDFANLAETEAALFHQPFEYIKAKVFRKRQQNNDVKRKQFWWRHGASGNTLRKATKGLDRFIVTTRHSKHRIFLWATKELVPDSALIAIARDDDYFFGVVHSGIHEIWSRAQGTQLRDVHSGFRYTPRSTFDTFPFPWPPGKEPTCGQDKAKVDAISAATSELVRLRDGYLNPPGKSEAELQKLTLTNLYSDMKAGNATWLENAHRALDEAVFAAYGWPSDLTTPEILSRLLALNHARAAAQSSATPTLRRKKKAHSPSVEGQRPADISV